jgi:UV DNA damage endonuclease
MSSKEQPIQLGLCCLNMTLRSQNPSIFCSRKMIIRTIRQKGIIVLKQKIIENLHDLYKLIMWNESHGIRVLRISSGLFPHYSNPRVVDYDMEFADKLLKKIGEVARNLGHRLTFHPGQYNVVGTPNEKTFQQTIRNLSYHAEVLDRMDMGSDSVMVVHGGGMYGDKEETKKRWCKNYMRLPKAIRKRLVLENCEKCFSIKDCLDVTAIINIPIVFDTHHYECYKLMHPTEDFKPAGEYISDILKTWKNRGIKPKFHVSEQGTGRCGHHSDYIDIIPDYLLEIPEKYNVNIDIMIEAKKKELAIFELYKTYPFFNCLIKS